MVSQHLVVRALEAYVQLCLGIPLHVLQRAAGEHEAPGITRVRRPVSMETEGG